MDAYEVVYERFIVLKNMAYIVWRWGMMFLDSRSKAIEYTTHRIGRGVWRHMAFPKRIQDMNDDLENEFNYTQSCSFLVFDMNQVIKLMDSDSLMTSSLKVKSGTRPRISRVTYLRLRLRRTRQTRLLPLDPRGAWGLTDETTTLNI